MDTPGFIAALLLVVDAEPLIAFATLAIRFAHGDQAAIEDAALASLLEAARDRARRCAADEEDRGAAPAWLMELQARPRPPIPGFSREP